ncbi:MAG: hypothetical protein AAFZ18_37865, partial [Myxococcota bacterium]
MNNDAFLRHHGLSANPFRGEEARQDIIFERIESDCRHPDFDKILGDLDHPSSSVVFGERGSGKTAIRLQIERILKERDMALDGGPRIWMVAYDDFNDLIARFMRTVDDDSPQTALREVELVDHMDGIMIRTVPTIVDSLLRDRADAATFGKPSDVRKSLRSLPEETRRRILALQFCYDRPGAVGQRARRLKSLLRVPGSAGIWAAKAWTLFLLFIALGWAILAFMQADAYGVSQEIALIPAGLLLLGAAYFGLAKWAAGARRLWLKARRLARSIRVDDRDANTFQEALGLVPFGFQTQRDLPIDEGDAARYAMFDALVDLLDAVGYSSMMVLVDRLDEPTAINGDAQRMKAFIWPMFNNKFLQMRGVGFKLLLPLELRGEILREREDFFREARLDKQHMIERLQWSGAMLYDLCNARYRACLARNADKGPDANMMALFEDNVNRQDVVDALDQLQQPRDAFKFLYAVVQEHCSNTTAEDGDFQI